jgi:two-component system, chemotaxis family, chemotaxis protein CheY
VFAVFKVCNLADVLRMVPDNSERASERRAIVLNARESVRLSIRILIADDNASVRAAMRQVLEGAEHNWEVIEAEDGYEAVAKAQELKPDLIIVDLVMPVMDGLTAAREMVKLLPDVPILMHTLYLSESVGQEAGKIGVRKTVAKSDSRVLISAVEELLHSKPPESQRASSDITAMRRTEDKIRELCAQLFASQDDAHANILAELQGALHQHIEHLRTRVAQYPAVVERRARLWIPPLARDLKRAAAKGRPSAKPREPQNPVNAKAAGTGPVDETAKSDSP